jgi:catechol 2,3-dioxygenase-like lactoylglutathione lyase family enzyme
MKFNDRYPIIVTERKNECRDFWTRHLDFEVGFDSEWFVWLHGGEGSASIAFMTPDHPSAPPGPEPFSGKGVCFELQVADVDVAHARFANAGLPIQCATTSEPFGQRRFGFFAPAGLWVDVVQQIEPVPGYWERYLRAD